MAEVIKHFDKKKTVKLFTFIGEIVHLSEDMESKKCNEAGELDSHFSIRFIRGKGYMLVLIRHKLWLILLPRLCKCLPIILFSSTSVSNKAVLIVPHTFNR